MSFQQGLSGLNSSSKALDVVGNNIANANTVGFKSAETHFADVYANSLSGSGASQVGIGATISGIQQTFSQGNITATNNPLDISINGGGFFRMEDASNNPTYTRNGQFHLDKNGYIVNDQLLNLTGFPGDATSGTAGPFQLSAAQIAPKATGDITATLNLDARKPDLNVPFNLTNPLPSSYNYSTAPTVYDSLGVPHTLTFFFVRQSPGNNWDVNARLDDAAAANVGQLTFNSSGGFDATATTSFSLRALPLPPGVTLSLGNVDFSDTTQYGSESSVGIITQNGYAPGSLTGLSVTSDGVVQGRYSNGQANTLGRIVLASFANSNGLQSLGNNQWQATSISGSEQLDVPGAGTKGVLQSASVEESNVDLTAQLVNMITQQRNYQANAQTIKTQDQIMQTLVNLR